MFFLLIAVSYCKKNQCGRGEREKEEGVGRLIVDAYSLWDFPLCLEPVVPFRDFILEVGVTRDFLPAFDCPCADGLNVKFLNTFMLS